MAAARPTCWRRCRCWFPAAACAARAPPTCARHGGAGGWAVAGRFATADGETGYRHRHTAGRPAWRRADRARVPPRRRRAAQPGGDRRPRRRGLADPADGSAVPGGRCPAAAASSIAWSGRWSQAMRARSPRTTRRWPSATGCWRRSAAGPGLACRPGGRHGSPRRGRHRGAHGPGGPAERGAAGITGLSRPRASAWPARSPNGWRRMPALAVEDWLRARPRRHRARDAAAGTAALGAHRTDMVLTDAATGTPAALASTGEQKALLIGVDPAPCRADRRGARLRPAAAARRTGGASRSATRRAALFAALRASAGADPDHRHRRGDVPAACRRAPRACACMAENCCRMRVFRRRNRPVPLCPERCSGYISRVSTQHSGVARRHVRRHRAAA